MRTTFMVIGFAFIAIGSTFIAQATRAEDPKGARDTRFSGIMFLAGGLLFLVASFSSYFRGDGE